MWLSITKRLAMKYWSLGLIFPDVDEDSRHLFLVEQTVIKQNISPSWNTMAEISFSLDAGQNYISKP